MDAVEAAFARTAVGLERWDDPHPPPERMVADDEYSRVTNPAKWRIVGARADAWIDATVSLGLATVVRDTDLRWAAPPGPAVTSTHLLAPVVLGGLQLVICKSRIENVEDAGIALGMRSGALDDAVGFTFVPDCGCDACDSGSQDVLDEIDGYLRSVVTGTFRHLTSPLGTVMVTEDGRRSASYGPRRRFDPDSVLADPVGWTERSGPSWLDDLV